MCKDILVIGAGTRRLDRPQDVVYYQDVQPLPGIDTVCDFWDIPNTLQSDYYDEVHMTHVLEHFPMAKTIDALKIVNGLLKKGGKLYIEVPNFYWHALEIIKDPKNRQIVEYAYGGQLNEWDYHYNGFTPEILRDDLVMAGFEVGMLVPGSSIEVWSTKL